MSEYLDLAIGLAKEAGGVIRENFKLAMDKEWKEERSPVTATDLAINELALSTIKRHYPTHSILSEEGSHVQEESEYVWICDPVDGTHNFAHGIPTATFAVALTHEGLPVIAVIFDPFMDRLFSAEKGKGSRLNGEPIRVSSSQSVKRTVIGMGKMKDARNLFPFYEEVRERGATCITGLSIHYMCALVAAGEMSAAFFGGPAPHDITASKLLVEEAGGVATDLFGKVPERFDVDMRGQLVSNGHVHEELLKLLDETSSA